MAHELHRLAGQARRRSSPAQRMPARRMLVADSCGDHARALGGAQTGAVGQDAGIAISSSWPDLGSRPSMIQLKRTLGVHGQG